MVGNIRSSRLHCNGNVAQAIKAELKEHQSELSTLDYTQIQQYGYEKYKNFSFDLLDLSNNLMEVLFQLQ